MNTSGLKLVLICACAAVASACGGGSGYSGDVTVGGSGFCDSISGGGSTLTANCTSCTVANQGNAADNDLETYADVQISNTSTTETATFRATAQNGVSFPGGGKAGEFVSQTGSSSTSTDTTIKTYLHGIPQESANPSIAVTDAGVYFYITTHLQYDAVEIVTHNSRGSITDPSPVYRVYEICSDGGQ